MKDWIKKKYVVQIFFNHVVDCLTNSFTHKSQRLIYLHLFTEPFRTKTQSQLKTNISNYMLTKD